MKPNIKPLCHLSLGDRAVVHSSIAKGNDGCRLTDLGFVAGAGVCAIHSSPFGDPTAYEIMGAVIALRDEDAHKILIEI